MTWLHFQLFGRSFCQLGYPCAGSRSTAFSDGARVKKFKLLPYGLKTATQTFQRTVNIILFSVLGSHTAAYLDDIVIFSRSIKEHLGHLEETPELLYSAGLHLNPGKCEIAARKLKFLCFEVSSEGMSLDRKKLTAIAKMSHPKDVRGVRRFLGAAGYFRLQG